jgi:predicted MFS family arabinose efflux permease
VNLNVAGLGWRTIFLVNIPVGLAAIVVGARNLPRHEPATPGARPDVRGS